MILGKIVGKVTTTRFLFDMEAEANKFDYVQVYHKDADYVLCQIIEIEKVADRTTAICHVLGYKDEQGRVQHIRKPFEPGTEVLPAQDEFIKDIVQLKDPERGAFIGKLEGRDINVYLDLQQLLTKHVAVLAKSGAGKSYCVGVLLEEIMEKNVPLVIIDPHGEYNSLKYKNEQEQEQKLMQYFKIKPKGYLRHIREYGDEHLNQGIKPLLLSDELRGQELEKLLPSKLSSAQQGLLYTALKKLDYFTFADLKAILEQEENNAKWNLIAMIDYLENLGIFSKACISFNELVQTGKCSIINLKGIPPDVQDIIVYKLLKDLFEQRKKNTIPPFFCVIEEAHNFCPERSFSSTKSGEIIRTIASEGRKFGLGLAIISQRPARVEKSVLSQLTTQIILKVTNPNDLKAISSSVEGITSESQDEIQNLSIGSALVTGVVDMPLFVSIRPRRTLHGGSSVDMLNISDDKNFVEEVKDFDSQGLLPLVLPKISLKDAKLMSPSGKVLTQLIPAVMFVCASKSGTYSLLVELVEGSVVSDVDRMISKKLPEIDKLAPMQLKALKHAYYMKQFSVEEFISKTKLSFDIVDVLDELAGLGYLIKKSNNRYSINEDIILSQLGKYACFEKIQYKAVPTDKTFTKRVRLDTLKARVNKFAAVQDMRECFLVHYDEVQ